MPVFISNREVAGIRAGGHARFMAIRIGELLPAAARSFLLCPLLVASTLSGVCSAQSGWSFETEGKGCPEVTRDSGPVLYGTMPAGAWSLDGSSLTYVSNGPNWRVRSGGAFLPIAPGSTPLAANDDGVVGPLNLPFTFTYPGGVGATTAIDVNPNGRVYFEAGTNSFGEGWDADSIIDNFLLSTPSVCALGADLNVGSGGAIYFETRTVGSDQVALVTWDSVPEYPNEGMNTVQCQLWSTGRVVVSMQGTNGVDSLREALVGVSAGGGALDPGPSPLTVPLGLSLLGTPILGEEFTIQVRGVPATATTGMLGVSIDRPERPAPTPWGTPPGCEFQLGQPVLRVPITLNPPYGTVTLNAEDVAALTGLNAQLQAFVMDPAQGTPNPMLMSDRGALTIGVPPALAFVVAGENSYYGSPTQGGFFALKSSPAATHGDIIRLEVSAVGSPLHFDTEGNAGVGAQGYFSDGNGNLPGSRNAFNSTDAAVGLEYGLPGQPASCDGTGTTGWIGSSAVAGSTTRFRELTFDFADFSAGETFGFDCDTDGGDYWPGVHTFSVTVTFADSTQVTATVQTLTNERAEGVLIP